MPNVIRLTVLYGYLVRLILKQVFMLVQDRLDIVFFSYREEILSCQESTGEIAKKVEQTANSEWIGSLSW